MKLKNLFFVFLSFVAVIYFFEKVAVRSYKAGAGICTEQRRVLTDQEFLDAVVEKIVDKSKQKNKRKEGIHIQYNSVGEFYQKTRQHYKKLDKAYYEINRMPEGEHTLSEVSPLWQRSLLFGTSTIIVKVGFLQFLDDRKPYSSAVMWLDECAKINDFQFYESGSEGSALPTIFILRGFGKQLN